MSLAEAELERQRHYALTSNVAQLGQSCLSALPANVSCLVNTYPCHLNANALHCVNAPVDPTELVAHQVSVEVGGATLSPFELQTVVRQ